ncbi:MAG: Translin family protein [bacterium ADurb.Bin429]|nr:MAG: Translin family protein [bacterium ADurb.Bin429]
MFQMDRFREICETIRGQFDEKDAAREKGLALSREVVRNSANAIRAIHRGQFDEARRLIAATHGLVREANAVLADFPDVMFAGFLHDAQKEFAEAAIFLSVVAGDALPDPDALDVQYPAYLHGVGDATGEMRRLILDRIRAGMPAVAETEELLNAMDEIYFELITFDYPAAITAGLRRITDVLRGTTERTRGDLSLAISQQTVQAAIQDARAALERREQG